LFFLLFISDTIARSISDETEATVEQIPRESQITPPQTPSTTVRQNQESCSFFGRRRRHRHHHRQASRARRYEVKEFFFNKKLKSICFCFSFIGDYIDIGTTGYYN